MTQIISSISGTCCRAASAHRLPSRHLSFRPAPQCCSPCRQLLVATTVGLLVDERSGLRRSVFPKRALILSPPRAAQSQRTSAPWGHLLRGASAPWGHLLHGDIHSSPRPPWPLLPRCAHCSPFHTSEKWGMRGAGVCMLRGCRGRRCARL